ncbi:MAG: hypothetical protein J5787_08875 [Alphaproteobacteria bacterium]|nr:hypothetical protein [Alphaproteobacteria bacterium]MBO4643632.1 hypothetical protein [Alphaproteobacteria bacterium]
MKKYLLALVCFLFASATAQAGIYLSGGIGLNFHNDSKTTYQDIRYKYKPSTLLSGAVGYAFPVVPVRLEIEGLYSKSRMKDINDHMITGGAAANVYAQIPLLGLYVGAGGGYASVRKKSTPVYQGMIGVEFGLFGVNLGIEGRHLQSSKNIKKFQEESSFRADMMLLKLRLEF